MPFLYKAYNNKAFHTTYAQKHLIQNRYNTDYELTTKWTQQCNIRLDDITTSKKTIFTIMQNYILRDNQFDDNVRISNIITYIDFGR